jgi:hypothetical protein
MNQLPFAPWTELATREQANAAMQAVPWFGGCELTHVVPSPTNKEVAFCIATNLDSVEAPAGSFMVIVDSQARVTQCIELSGGVVECRWPRPFRLVAELSTEPLHSVVLINSNSGQVVGLQLPPMSEGEHVHFLDADSSLVLLVTKAGRPWQRGEVFQSLQIATLGIGSLIGSYHVSNRVDVVIPSILDARLYDGNVLLELESFDQAPRSELWDSTLTHQLEVPRLSTRPPPAAPPSVRLLTGSTFEDQMERWLYPCSGFTLEVVHQDAESLVGRMLDWLSPHFRWVHTGFGLPLTCPVGTPQAFRATEAEELLRRSLHYSYPDLGHIGVLFRGGESQDPRADSTLFVRGSLIQVTMPEAALHRPSTWMQRLLEVIGSASVHTGSAGYVFANRAAFASLFGDWQGQFGEVEQSKLIEHFGNFAGVDSHGDFNWLTWMNAAQRNPERARSEQRWSVMKHWLPDETIKKVLPTTGESGWQTFPADVQRQQQLGLLSRQILPPADVVPVEGGFLVQAGAAPFWCTKAQLGDELHTYFEVWKQIQQCGLGYPLTEDNHNDPYQHWFRPSKAVPNDVWNNSSRLSSSLNEDGFPL